jgi:uncharacterized DUF497 family protein
MYTLERLRDGSFLIAETSASQLVESATGPRYNRDVMARFEWDEDKDRANQRKHAVSFATAARVFDDPQVVILSDRIVNGEERWQAIGLIDGIHLLLVAHTDRSSTQEEVIRIISARKADRSEERTYERANR